MLSLETSPRKTKPINSKKLKAESPQPVSKTENVVTASPRQEQDDDVNLSSTSLLSTSSSSSSSSSSSTSETTTLIDPVTGLLIPMQESEEGQYVPIDDQDNNDGYVINIYFFLIVPKLIDFSFNLLPQIFL